MFLSKWFINIMLQQCDYGIGNVLKTLHVMSSFI